jgi:very-short-patch-repair endonuclease
MTLHVAIEKLLKEKGTSMSTNEIATELNENKWYRKKDGSEISALQIHGRTRNYPNIFDRQGSIVTLNNGNFKPTSKPIKKQKFKKSTNRNTDSDEKYVIDLCDRILNLKASRQHKFDFLLGDINSRGFSAKLPVDAYYQELKLVVEYRERQHTENVNFFDKPIKLTVSGVHRGEQRKIYDQRRDEILPKNGINLIKISYNDFDYDNRKRILRNEKEDIKTIEKLIKGGIKH